jgi:hypothetical protein
MGALLMQLVRELESTGRAFDSLLGDARFRHSVECRAHFDRGKVDGITREFLESAGASTSVLEGIEHVATGKWIMLAAGGFDSDSARGDGG